MGWGSAAVGKDDELSRVVPTSHGHLANQIGHLCSDNFINTGRCLHDGQSQRPRNLILDGRFGLGPIQPLAPAKKIFRVQQSQDQGHR